MDAIDKTLELPEPWYWTEQDLSTQLQIEIGTNHILKSQQTQTVARRQDNDDVLYQIENGFAVVHLTWQNHPHKDAFWPATEIYSGWDDVFRNRILNDADEFG